MIYLLDANVFIQAKNLHYGFDFCPAFWDWIIKHHSTGKVYSIDKVADEINAGEDDLTEWAKANSPLFLNTDAQVVKSFGQVGDWVSAQKYDQAAINTFLQLADFYLIAHALAGSYTVVTHEKPANSTKIIKIPNVCAALDIKFVTPYQMLQIEKAKFVLGAR